MDTRNLLRRLEEALARGPEHRSRLEEALEVIAQGFGAMSATLHRADPRSRLLRLLAARGIPEAVLALTRSIPYGKGMAGLCAVRREPVTVCNVQTDSSGDVRPGARETGVSGAVVVPVLAPRDREVCGTLGIGKAAEHTYAAEELSALLACAALLAPHLDEDGTGPAPAN